MAGDPPEEARAEDPDSAGSTRAPAVELGGAVVPVRASRRAAPPADPQATRRGLMIVVPLVIAGTAIAGLVLTQMKDNAIYSKPVDELVAQKAKFKGRPVRAEGNLVHGSLTKRETPCEYRFTIEKNGVDVPVRFAQ